MEQIITRHGVQSDLLSDRGANLSNLMKEVCELMGIHRVNTTAYHPQTDGLVERYNRTLIEMSKSVEKNGRDWDTRLPYVLFAYRASLKESTKESPFFLLYGRDPRLPTETALCTPLQRSYLEIDDYKSELVVGLTEAWRMARDHVQKAQRHQKKFYNRHTKDPTYWIGDRVFVFMPAAKAGKAHKFARPYHGPYRVMDSNARVVWVDRPQDTPIFVALDRLRHCPQEIPEGEAWPQTKKKKTIASSSSAEEGVSAEGIQSQSKGERNPGVWAQRMRPRGSRTPGVQGGEM